MAGKTDFIVNGSFERQAGGDAAAWIDASPQFDVFGDGHTYQFRATLPPDGPPDGWTVTHGFFGLEEDVPIAGRAAWDGKVWGLAHDGSIAQQVTGLTAGTVYDLALVAFHPVWPVASALQVFWNGQRVADFENLTDDPGHVTHVLLTAGAGTNQLELRTTSVVTLDDVRLFAAGPGDLVDFSQSTQPVGANLGDVEFRSQFDGIPTLPSLPALHAYVGGVAQPLNGITSVIGGSANDLLVASPKGGSMDGRGGADAVVGGAGDDTLNGGAGNDLVVGGDGRDHLRGDDGDDFIQGGAGDDLLDGGPGNDTASYSGNASSYAVSQGADGSWTVSDLRNGAPEGVDRLTNVEVLKFSDRTVSLVTALPATIDSAFQSITRAASASAGNSLLASNVSIGLATGTLSQGQAVTEIVQAAGATASVATLAYEFFTGSAPSAGGMDFLVSPTGPNPNNLNGAYYQGFALENRYINFAVNLGKVGEGNAAFTSAYGALSLFEATRKAYTAIFGDSPSDAKLHAILDPTTVLNGQSFSRADYFAYYGQDGANGIGTKAAMVGWLLSEAVKADLGTYALSNDAFLTDVALHSAPFAVDIIGHYAQPGFVYHPG